MMSRAARSSPLEGEGRACGAASASPMREGEGAVQNRARWRHMRETPGTPSPGRLRRLDLSLKGRGGASIAAVALFSSVALTPAVAQQKGDRAFGEYLASECVTCHQPSGQFSGIPPIVGWPDESFVAVMNEYRHKKRENPVMQTIAARLSDEEIAALAAYFGSLTLKPKAP